MDKFKVAREYAPISAPFQAVTVENACDVNLLDGNYYDGALYLDIKAADKNTSSAYFQKEGSYIAKMKATIAEGRSLLSIGYAFRSCGKAIPQLQSQEQENKAQLYQTTCEVLRPVIARMTKFMEFRDKLVAVFTEALSGIIPEIRDKDYFPSEEFLLTLANLLDLTVSLDIMKNFKGSMSNDLSMYKRAKTMIVKDFNDLEYSLLPRLGIFLANKDQYAMDIKASLSTMSNTYEEVFCLMIHLCMEYFEKETYILAKTKHIYLRAMACAIWLIDGEGEDFDFVKKKKIKVEKVGKILRSNDVVPLFGDIAVSLSSINTRSPHWNSGKYDLKSAEEAVQQEIQRQYLLVNRLASTEEKYLEIVANLHRAKISSVSLNSMTVEDQKSYYDTILQSLKFLSGLTNQVLEQAAWKYLNPANAGDSDLNTVYERSVQYNYDPSEKKALILYISMIKSISGMLEDITSNAGSLICESNIRNEIHHFLTAELTEIYNQCLKKKKSVTPILKAVMDFLHDPNAKPGPITDTTRKEPISATQLYICRASLDLMFNEKAKGMKGGLMKEKTFKDSQVAELQSFFDKSFYYGTMLDLPNSILKCSDLSNLWFKEFYLELTKQIQFPTRTSLPWILSEFALDTNDFAVLQNMFLPLDLYNDAANATLHHLKSRFIYDEIEAEVNMCFDQFTFKLGRDVYRHYKKIASIQVLEADDIETSGKPLWPAGSLPPDAYVNVLMQKDIKILGRNIDINDIISQMLENNIRTSLGMAISRFEARELTTGIQELEALISVNRKTHFLLSKVLKMAPFDDILKEADESTKLGEFNGRIIAHFVEEIVNDIIPNYCFNNVTKRFVRGTVFYGAPVQRVNMPKTKFIDLFGSKAASIEYAMKIAESKECIGDYHLYAMYRLLGRAGFGIICNEINTHVGMIMKAMPKFLGHISNLSKSPIRFPVERADFESQYEYQVQQYKELANYNELRGEILQVFREIGNAVCVTRVLEDIVIAETSLEHYLVQDVVPFKINTNFIEKFKTIDQNIASDVFSLEKWATTVENDIADSGRKATLMRRLLKTMAAELKDIDDFKEAKLTEDKNSYASICSILQFVSSIPPQAGGKTIRALFGDGLPMGFYSIMFAYRQSAVCKALDINEYLVSLYRKGKSKDSPEPSIEVLQYLNNANWFSNTNEECQIAIKYA